MPLDDRLRQGLNEEAAGIEPDVGRHLALVRGRARGRGMPARRLAVAVVAVTAVVLLAWGTSIDPAGVLDGLREHAVRLGAGSIPEGARWRRFARGHVPSDAR